MAATTVTTATPVTTSTLSLSLNKYRFHVHALYKPEMLQIHVMPDRYWLPYAVERETVDRGKKDI